MKKTTVIGVAAAATLCVTAIAMQDRDVQDAGFSLSPEAMKAMSPGPQHAKLAQLVGDYNLELKFRMGPEQPWETANYTAEREMVMDGRQLNESVEGEWMGQAFKGASIVGYDNIREEYHSVWYDNMSTGLMVSTGTADASGAVTFEGTGSDCMTLETNKWFKSVMSADGSTFDMYTKTPDGAEFKCMTIAYTRK